jgi:hypothetical protein
MSRRSGEENPEPRRAGRRQKIKMRRPWDSVCGNCGRYIEGFAMRRPVPWQKVLPYCRNCYRYALRGVHAAALAAVFGLLVAGSLLALYLLLR